MTPNPYHHDYTMALTDYFLDRERFGCQNRIVHTDAVKCRRTEEALDRWNFLNRTEDYRRALRPVQDCGKRLTVLSGEPITIGEAVAV